jgi:hypothetical protein
MSQHIPEDELVEILKRLPVHASVNDVAVLADRPPEEIDAILEEIRSDKASGRLRRFAGANRYYYSGVFIGVALGWLFGFVFGRVIGM